MSFIYSILTTPTNQAKTFSLDADGKLVKSSLANPTKGTFSKHSVETIEAFARDLNNITINQTIILGQPHRPDGTALQVGEKIGLTIKAKPSDSAISIVWFEHPGRFARQPLRSCLPTAGFEV